MGVYEVRFEVSGPTAIWTRPDTGDVPASYPVPTRSAVKGLFESVLWLPNVVIHPTRVEICKPIVFHNFTTNYGGPLRKSGTSNFQLVATVLINVAYRLYARVRNYDGPLEQVSHGAKAWRGTNSAHAYQEMFEKRIERGQWFRTPCLGWQEFVPDYLGVFREPTRVQEDINLTLASMLDSVFPHQNDPSRRPAFRQNIQVTKGVLQYAP